MNERRHEPRLPGFAEMAARRRALAEELVERRISLGLSQTEVAARMGTKTPAVARLEAGGGSRRHSPSVATLRKYAQAVGCRVEIRLRPHGGRKSKAEQGAAADRPRE